MIRKFSTYSIKKFDQAFSLPGGEVLPKTAIVSFLKENGQIVSTLELGVVSADYLLERIAKGQENKFG